MQILENFKFTNDIWVLVLPSALMAIDFITGVLHAWSSGKFKSKKMREGLTKKVGELAILTIGELFTFGMRIPPYIMGGVSAYIIFMESMSIAENLKKMGIKIPAFVSKAFSAVDSMLQEEDLSEAVKKAKDIQKEVEAVQKKEE